MRGKRPCGAEQLGRMASHPDYLWAQTKDELWVTIAVPNVSKEGAVVQLFDEGRIEFQGTGGVQGEEKEYCLKIELLHPIDAAASRYNVGARNIELKVKKASSGPYWDKLTKEKDIHCKVDWDHWVDEDEEKAPDFGASWSGADDLADLDFGAEQKGDADDIADGDMDEDADMPEVDKPADQ
ncbi:Uncharacterized protein FVE85_0581 [Porphyridium purpureum]|uniref:CS domain-containing protein n=1 Tax=Porphyridium purpureum TaxID=35688 RepID=A0A5J4Z143_PORPP|nr:Uncharacterized protein FVE85_0581 [Porphyridium purpureum]|eukprot:POR5659..scf208_2